MATSTLQLEFSQAMADFKKMFPDIDREVIEAVLRANLGAVDQTIDQLLAMSTDNQNEKLRNELDANISPQQSLINLSDTDREVRRNHQQQIIIDAMDSGPENTVPAVTPNAGHTQLLSTTAASPNHNTGASPKQRPIGASTKISGSNTINTTTKRNISHTVGLSNNSRNWSPPILGVLPPGFLRVAPSGGQQDFELPDEQFALMLQNEEFMNQLRWNQDFMSALEKEQSGKAKGEDDAPFQERLKNMGKMSRKKFLQMARVFTWQRNKKVTTAKQIDSLPLREEHSDDEDHNQQQQQQSQQQQQQSHQQQQSQVQSQGQLQLRK
ncbi:CUE domain-containing protein 1 isoform X1 [Drosophila navojoa]|uniref:CUE domain-containing protein 1 isoform X1 n=1 Tax=Drosophila navojoa TaxID=7232 RepID=UPI0011BE28FB|nr:CUE domain-containing protein 1 isoform X1 [Drosophila navojoa]